MLFFLLLFLFLSMFLCNSIFAVIQCKFFLSFTHVKPMKKYYIWYLILFHFSSVFDHYIFMTGLISTISGILLLHSFLHRFVKLDRTNSLLASLLTVLINGIVEGLFQPIYERLPIYGVTLQFLFLYLLLKIVIILSTGICFFLISRRYHQKWRLEKPYNLVLLLPVWVMAVSIRQIKPTKMANTIFLLAIVAFICLYGILLVVEKITICHLIEHEKTQLIGQLELEQQFLTESERRYQTSCTFRHDFKNHLLVLQELLNKNKIKDCLLYLDNINQKANQINKTINSGNTALDALLTSKYKTAQELGIMIKDKISLDHITPIEIYDMCSLFGNIFDNAINACSGVEQTERFIEIKAGRRKGFIVVEMKNTYRKGYKKSGTGIGLVSIQALVEKYHGTMDILCTDSVFQISILLAVAYDAAVRNRLRSK